MEKLIVLDVGTTGVKAALLDREGRILSEDYRAYPMNVHGDRIEQDPLDWWKGAVAVLSSVSERAAPGAVAGVCLGGQMQDLITLDATGYWARSSSTPMRVRAPRLRPWRTS